MVAIVTAAVLIASGEATRYGPGTMDGTVAYRSRVGQIPPGTDPYFAVAMLEKEMIGEVVWLEVGGEFYGPLTVADCAQANHRESLIDRGWVIDVSYELGVELGMEYNDIDYVRVWNGLPRQFRRLVPR